MPRCNSLFLLCHNCLLRNDTNTWDWFYRSHTGFGQTLKLHGHWLISGRGAIPLAGTAELTPPGVTTESFPCAFFSINVSDLRTLFSLVSGFAELSEKIPRNLTVLAGAFLRLVFDLQMISSSCQGFWAPNLETGLLAWQKGASHLFLTE